MIGWLWRDGGRLTILPQFPRDYGGDATTMPHFIILFSILPGRTQGRGLIAFFTKGNLVDQLPCWCPWGQSLIALKNFGGRTGPLIKWNKNLNVLIIKYKL